MVNSSGSTLKRRDKVEMKLKELSRTLDFAGWESLTVYGFDAEFIAGQLGIDRANTSKELNQLLEAGKILKIKGKPVLYLDKAYLETALNCKVKDSVFADSKSFSTFVRRQLDGADDKAGDAAVQAGYGTFSRDSVMKPVIDNPDNLSGIFDIIIGADKSLKAQIELAKAAILYPPSGIHTLIVGPTGVGKSTFAEVMYKYAVLAGRVAPDAPFVIFNCADYSDNPQLLISQLFGHTKGAYTGAEKEKSGLISQADGGILFLDEVHRLPPEGQEMLFLLMDKGIYRRLGETESTRSAKVLIIAATTEDPKSSMLNTFLRRIPATIELPGLDKRTLEERVDLISQFFWEESSRIKAPIRVSKEVLRAFIFYDCPGNIGQLKGDIQLICAKAFLDYMSSGAGCMEVKLSHLSQPVQEGLFKIRDKHYGLLRDHGLNLNEDISFDGSDMDYKKYVIEPVDKIRYERDYYGCIINNWNKYSRTGLSEKEIRSKIENDLEEYFQSFYTNINDKRSSLNNDIIQDIVTPNVMEAVEYALASVQDIYGEAVNDRVKCGLALHINNLIERLNTGNVISHPNRENIEKDHPVEYDAAQKIRWALKDRLGIDIPDDEAAFIAMLLYAIKTTKYRESIGVLVIAHGKAAASSMADVTNALLGVQHARAIDMPLDERVESVLEKATDEVRKLDRGKGVLILVDMGSLVKFADIITERTGIRTACIDMVNTIMVIEATRKAILPNISLDMLVEDVTSTVHMAERKDQNSKYAIAPEDPEEYFRSNLIETLGNILTFLNPKKAYEALKTALESIVKSFGREMDNDILVKFMFHCSCMVERAIKNEPLYKKSLKAMLNERKDIFEALKGLFEVVEETFDITICDAELAYVIEMLDTHYNTLTCSKKF